MVQLAERVQESEEPAVAPLESVAPPEVGPSWWWVFFVGLTLLALVLRLYDLGARAMHHDESLHALYSWSLYVGRGYVHDPMMHGPGLFEGTALMYFLFGDSEVTARLIMALMGTGIVVLPYFLRHELGRFGAVAAAAFLALEPSFVYFSRFARHDAMVVFEAMLLVVGMFGWFRTRNSAYFYTAVVGLALLFSTKEDSFIYGFIFATFLVGATIVDRRRGSGRLLEGLAEIGIRRWMVAAAIFFGISAVLYTSFFTNLEGLCTAIWSPPVGSCTGKQGALQYWLSQQGVARGSQPWFYYFLLIPLYEILPLTLALVSPFIARRPRSLIFWFSAWWAITAIVIYTWAGEKMPWLVVHPVLPLILLASLSVDRIAGWLRLPWGLTARQWSVAGLSLLGGAAVIALAGLGGLPTDALESQTNTLRRIALVVVVVGIAAGTARAGWPLGRTRVLGALGVAGLVVLLLYTVRAGWQVNYKNGDTPVETLVYVQSSPDVPYVLSELDRLGNQLGMHKDLPILLDGGYTDTVAGQSVDHEAISWPFEWYLRDFKAKQYYSRNFPSDFSTNKYAAVLVMGPSLDPVRDDLGGYTGNKLKLNWWYPEDYKQLTWSTLFDGLLDPGVRTKLWKYIVYRDLVNPPLGAREFYFYVRNDLVGTQAGSAPSAASPSAPRSAPQTETVAVRNVTAFGRPNGIAALRDPKSFALAPDGRIFVVDGANANVTVFTRDGSVERSWGRAGTGDGEFTEPWGIALGPDGSIYVADTWNHRVQKFDSQGRFVTKWGNFGDAQGQIKNLPGSFFGPRDLVFNQQGELLVTDTGNKRIQAFDQDGHFLRAYGGEGRAVGQLREPTGIAVDSGGRIYVADTWNQRIQVFSAQFDPIAQYPVPQWTSQSALHKPYLAVSPSGDIYATIPERGTLLHVHDGAVTTLTLQGAPPLGLPLGIKVNLDGNLLVSDAQGASVLRYELPSPDLPSEQPE
ncbi:MAG: TIGR03663 family protein [Chloroflexi bacterium]|nr:TIGR03663 family protein [Chloroflexota bacterium]